MMVLGAGYLARVPLAYLQAKMGQAQSYSQPALLRSAKSVTSSQGRVVKGQVVNRVGLFPTPASFTAPVTKGELIGRVVIPSLDLTAPLIQGTSLGILAHAAGHLTGSVLPGQTGTAVIAAHDVTYFHHIDALKPGQTIEVTTSQGYFTYKVTGHQVVTVGTNVANTYYPSLVLETCYPLNALTLVNHRYLVSAVLSSSTLAAPSHRS